MTDSIGHDDVDGVGDLLIRQSQLEALHVARDVMNASKYQANASRDEILGLYDRNATVEAGPLDLRIEEKGLQTISKKAVKHILGRDALDKLLAAIEVKTVRTVRVVPRDAIHQVHNGQLFYPGWENE